MEKICLVDEVPYGVKFRQVVDLEEGETVDMLPVYVRAVVDLNAFQMTERHSRTGYVPVIVGGKSVSVIRPDTVVEIIE